MEIGKQSTEITIPDQEYFSLDEAAKLLINNQLTVSSYSENEIKAGILGFALENKLVLSIHNEGEQWAIKCSYNVEEKKLEDISNEVTQIIKGVFDYPAVFGNVDVIQAIMFEIKMGKKDYFARKSTNCNNILYHSKTHQYYRIVKLKDSMLVNILEGGQISFSPKNEPNFCGSKQDNYNKNTANHFTPIAHVIFRHQNPEMLISYSNMEKLFLEYGKKIRRISDPIKKNEKYQLDIATQEDYKTEYFKLLAETKQLKARISDLEHNCTSQNEDDTPLNHQSKKSLENVKKTLALILRLDHPDQFYRFDKLFGESRGIVYEKIKEYNKQNKGANLALPAQPETIRKWLIDYIPEWIKDSALK